MIKITDYYATWCRPCVQVAKNLELIREEFPEIEIEKVDVEKHPERYKAFNVKSIPFIVFEKDGEVVEKLIGMQSKRILTELIVKHNG